MGRAPCSKFRAWRGLSNSEDPGSEPVQAIGAVPISNSHSAVAVGDLTPWFRMRRAGSRGRGQSTTRRFKPCEETVRPPGSAGAHRAPTIVFLILSLGREVLADASHATGFTIAPSMSSPVVIYFHKATSSLRASAVIATFLRALVAPTPTRAKYQRANADCG